MGQGQSAFSEPELDEFQELTYFTKKEILHVYKRFKELAQTLAPNGRDDQFKQVKLPMDTILQLEELKVNPFRDRMCKVFSSDGSGAMSFEDFLDMMSVFSENAPKKLKAAYAFLIYDFDEDNKLNDDDLRQVINRLTGGEDGNQELPKEDMEMLIKNIYDEADLDNDKTISFTEFEHVLSRAPDFVTSFRIRL